MKFVYIVKSCKVNKLWFDCFFPGSPAESTDLEVGDEIVAVNGHTLEDCTHAEIIAYIHQVFIYVCNCDINKACMYMGTWWMRVVERMMGQIRSPNLWLVEQKKVYCYSHPMSLWLFGPAGIMLEIGLLS